MSLRLEKETCFIRVKTKKDKDAYLWIEESTQVKGKVLHLIKKKTELNKNDPVIKFKLVLLSFASVSQE